jgi:hypothetical protein
VRGHHLSRRLIRAGIASVARERGFLDDTQLLSSARSTPRNCFAKFVSLFLPFLQFPLHGLDFPFGTPPFGASPHAPHSAAIGKPNADGFVGHRFRIIDYGCFGRHSIAIELEGFHFYPRFLDFTFAIEAGARTIWLSLGPFAMRRGPTEPGSYHIAVAPRPMENIRGKQQTSPLNFRVGKWHGWSQACLCTPSVAAAASRLRLRQIWTGSTFQMSRAYSPIVRSLENFPMRAVFRIAILAQCALLRKARSTFSGTHCRSRSRPDTGRDQ